MHCLQLGRALRELGDDIAVFHISNTAPRRPRRLERGSDGDLQTYHCIDGMEYSRAADWPNRFLQDSFRRALEEFAPEIVHFHNYLSLGDDLVGIARALGAAVVYTLHDFGLVCPNNLLLRADGTLCGKCSPGFFQDCCPVTIRVPGQIPPAIAKNIPPLFRWRQFADNQPHAMTRAGISSLVSLAESILGEPGRTLVGEKKEFFLGATRRILDQTHLFLSPSLFLRERFIHCGLAPSRVVHHRYGLPRFATPPHRPSPNGKIRFGYIGAFHAHKGIDVLVEAFRGLAPAAELHLHGSSFGSPVSEAHFRKTTSAPADGFVVHGRYGNGQLGGILGGIDALVVPSVWYENSPLTIQEAQIAGVPVIASNAGGMAELVRDGIDGLLFQLGDPRDLRRVMASVIQNPALLGTLRANRPEVPSIDGQAAKIRDHYRAALSRARA